MSPDPSSYIILKVFVGALIVTQNSLAIPVSVGTGVGVNDLKLLKDWGYLFSDASAGQLLSEDSLEEAVKKLQRFAHLPETGVVDDATKVLLSTARCGVPDFGNSFRAKRFVLQGTQWQKSSLSWRLETPNDNGISDSDVRVTIANAFRKWRDVTNLEFSEIPSGTPDIRVRFERGYHDDPYPFDGKGGTLAHAFYPHSNTGLAGDVHFDDDEDFTIKDESSKRKLLWVAVHEIGHSIGLEHSDVKGAIMYPWYQHFPGLDFDLTYDDISGIQSIYGSRTSSGTRPPTGPSPVTPATVAVTVATRQCTAEVKGALLADDGQTYVFNYDKMYMLDKVNLGIVRGPLDVSKSFANLPFVDTVHRRHDNYISFFFGDKFAVFDGFNAVRPPRLITEGYQGLPPGFRDVDAAFVWPRNQRLYIFKGSLYWRLNTMQTGDYLVDIGYPKEISSAWLGIPDNVDAVFTWRNGKTYFFKGLLYYRLNDDTLSVSKGYPLKISDHFTRCSPGSLQGSNFAGRNPATSLSVIAFVSVMSVYLAGL